MRSMVVHGRGDNLAVHMTNEWQPHPMRPPIRLVVLSVLTHGTGDDETIMGYVFHGADGNVYRWATQFDKWFVHVMCPEAS